MRLKPYLEAAIAERLDQFCAAIDATESAVVTAIRQYVDGTNDATLYLGRLDRLGRAVARKRAAKESAGSRFRRFVGHVAEQSSGAV
ncbi:MAG: hypothetical protein ABSC94_32235, partial [Polyangiaceae bacterium]